LFEFAQNLVTLSCTASAVANNHADLIACCLARAVKQVPLAFLIYDFDEVLPPPVNHLDIIRHPDYDYGNGEFGDIVVILMAGCQPLSSLVSR